MECVCSDCLSSLHFFPLEKSEQKKKKKKKKKRQLKSVSLHTLLLRTPFDPRDQTSRSGGGGRFFSLCCLLSEIEGWKGKREVEVMALSQPRRRTRQERRSTHRRPRLLPPLLPPPLARPQLPPHLLAARRERPRRRPPPLAWERRSRRSSSRSAAPLPRSRAMAAEAPARAPPRAPFSAPEHQTRAAPAGTTTRSRAPPSRPCACAASL